MDLIDWLHLATIIAAVLLVVALYKLWMQFCHFLFPVSDEGSSDMQESTGNVMVRVFLGVVILLVIALSALVVFARYDLGKEVFWIIMTAMGTTLIVIVIGVTFMLLGRVAQVSDNRKEENATMLMQSVTSMVSQLARSGQLSQAPPPVQILPQPQPKQIADSRQQSERQDFVFGNTSYGFEANDDTIPPGW